MKQVLYTSAMSPRSKSYSQSEVNAALSGYIAGFSQRKISDILSIPRTTVREWMHEYDNGDIVSPTIPEHSHHWILGQYDGEATEGVCKFCFQKKRFRNQSRGMWTRRELEWTDFSVR